MFGNGGEGLTRDEQTHVLELGFVKKGGPRRPGQQADMRRSVVT